MGEQRDAEPLRRCEPAASIPPAAAAGRTSAASPAWKRPARRSVLCFVTPCAPQPQRPGRAPARGCRLGGMGQSPQAAPQASQRTARPCLQTARASLAVVLGVMLQGASSAWKMSPRVCPAGAGSGAQQGAGPRGLQAPEGEPAACTLGRAPRPLPEVPAATSPAEACRRVAFHRSNVFQLLACLQSEGSPGWSCLS